MYQKIYQDSFSEAHFMYKAEQNFLKSNKLKPDDP